MFAWLGFLIFITLGITCCLLSVKALKTYLTITNAITVPYIIICTIQMIVCSVYGFDYPIIDYWVIITFYTVGVFLTECIVQYIINGKSLKSVFTSTYVLDKYANSKLCNRIIVFIVIGALFFTWQEIRRFEVALLLQDEFQDQFQRSVGGSLYMRLTLMILSVYLLSYRKKLKWKILGVVAFFPNLVVNTKGIILIQILAILTILVLLKRIRNFHKFFLWVAIAGVSIFFVSYTYEGILSNWNIGDTSFFSKISFKLYSYLTGGVQAFSYNINHFGEEVYSKFPNATLVPFNSFLAKFGLGEAYSSVTDHVVPTGFPLSYCNVNSMYGTLYLFDGLWGGLGLLVFWCSIVSFLRFVAFKWCNPFDVVLFNLFFAGFLLGWFDLYFMQPFWIYLIVISYILKYLFNFILKCKSIVWQ